MWLVREFPITVATVLGLTGLKGYSWSHDQVTLDILAEILTKLMSWAISKVSGHQYRW